VPCAGGQVQIVFTILDTKYCGYRAGRHFKQVAGYKGQRLYLLNIGPDGRVDPQPPCHILCDRAYAKDVQRYTTCCSGFRVRTPYGYAIRGIFGVKCLAFLDYVNFVESSLPLPGFTVTEGNFPLPVIGERSLQGRPATCRGAVVVGHNVPDFDHAAFPVNTAVGACPDFVGEEGIVERHLSWCYLAPLAGFKIAVGNPAAVILVFRRLGV